MYFTSNSMWIIGKPHEIITKLHALKNEYIFVSQVIKAGLH